MDDFAALGVEIDEMLDWRDSPALFTGHDVSGTRCLGVLVAATPVARTWLLAAISQTALGCVLAGKAELRDVFRHTPTGFVETVIVEPSGRITPSVRLCTELVEADLPGAGERLAMVA